MEIFRMWKAAKQGVLRRWMKGELGNEHALARRMSKITLSQILNPFQGKTLKPQNFGGQTP